MICSRLDTFVASGPAFCTAMGFEPEPPSRVASGDDGDGERRKKKQVKCFDGTIPKTEGVPEKRTRNKMDEMNDLFRKYRKTRAGKAADQFVDLIDSIPSWLMMAISIFIGALLAGRIYFFGYAGGGGGRRLGNYEDDRSGGGGGGVDEDFE